LEKLGICSLRKVRGVIGLEKVNSVKGMRVFMMISDFKWKRDEIVKDARLRVARVCEGAGKLQEAMHYLAARKEPLGANAV